MAQAAQTCVAMNNFNLLSYDNVAEDWEEREDCRKGCRSVDDQKRYVIDLESICEVSNTSASFVCVCNNYNFVSAIDELGRKLVDMAFDSSGLGKEEIADHSNIVWHLCGVAQGLSPIIEGFGYS